MNKLIVACIVMLSLSGCFYQSVTNEDIERAEHFCKSVNSSVEEIEAHAIGSEYVICKNNQTALLNTYKELINE